MTEQEIRKNIDSLETMTDAALLFYAKEIEADKRMGGELPPMIAAYAIFSRLEKCDGDLTDEDKGRVHRIGIRLSNIVTLMETINEKMEN